MAVCESCGAKVQDGLTICSECGRPVKKMKTTLELKGQNGRKPKKATMFSPADEYGDVVDSNSVGGAEPVTVTKEKIEYYESENKKEKRKKRPGIFTWIIRLVVLAAIGYGVYYLCVNVLFKPDGPETYEEAFDAVIEATNSKDKENIMTCIPAYITDNIRVSEGYLSNMHDADIESAEIKQDTVHMWSKQELNAMNDDVQLQHGKTANIKEGVTFTAKLRGYARNEKGNRVARYTEVEMNFIKIKGVWYFDIESYDTSAFTKMEAIH